MKSRTSTNSRKKCDSPGPNREVRPPGGHPPPADGEGPRTVPEPGVYPEPCRPVRRGPHPGHGRSRGRERDPLLPNLAGRATEGPGANRRLGPSLTHARLGRRLDTNRPRVQRGSPRPPGPLGADRDPASDRRRGLHGARIPTPAGGPGVGDRGRPVKGDRKRWTSLGLGIGEASLFETPKGDRLILDEIPARTVAEAEGREYTGLLGLLLAGVEAGGNPSPRARGHLVKLVRNTFR